MNISDSLTSTEPIPTGTVTFLFTDVEGATSLAYEHPDELPHLLAKHHEILQEVAKNNQGHVFQIIGDAFCIAFHTAADAVNAALEAQRRLQREAWNPAPVRVRMGIHTGSVFSKGWDDIGGGYSGYIPLAHVQRVMSAAYGEQVLLSDSAAKLLDELLPDGITLLDVGEHKLKGMVRAERLWQLAASDLPREFPPISSLEVIPNNLPLQLNSFIGRRREIDEIQAIFITMRLLTLTGPGGAGKTRLSIRVASDMNAMYPDGVWLTELASLSDGELVPQAVASSLGVQEQAGSKVLESLVKHLQHQRALLVLDNCEHLLDSCAQLSASILEACPGVRILATSREPLGVPGEVVWVVPPLSLPEPQPWRSPEFEREALAAYQQSEAIQLFIERAAAASPSFQLDGQNAPWVAEICRRLDGIPLAIELAAARMRTFSPHQIAERLDDRFRLLTSQIRIAPPRHRALEATLDWSYDLLSDAEKKALQRLSVFASGWTLEAAEAVCSDGDINPGDVMGVLSSLVDKSLVVVDGSHDSKRYRLLETIRQYALQKLEQTGETSSVRDRHLEFFLQWAEASAEHLEGRDQPSWAERFDAEHENLRIALEWSVASEERQNKGLRLAVACGLFWRLRGYLTEGRERLQSALNQKAAKPVTLARAWALLWSANLAYVQSDFPATRRLAEEGLAVSGELGLEGKPAIARALDMLGELATEAGDYETASILFEEALSIYRDLDQKRGTADMLMQLGWSAMRAGIYEQADIQLNECLFLFRELGESVLLGLALAGLGELSLRRARIRPAITYLEESLRIRRELGERWGIAAALGSLGWAALLERDFDRVRELLGESIAMRMEIGERGGIAWCLEKLAEAAFFESQALPAPYNGNVWYRAVRIFGGAAALRRPINSVIDLVDQPAYERLLSDLRSALGERSFDSAWREGEITPLTEVVGLALSPALSQDEVAALTKAQAKKVKYGGLSPREREAALLVAQGKTNREIAENMFVQEKTVETYVTRILNKLGYDSRVQIATWVYEVGLPEHEPNER